MKRSNFRERTNEQKKNKIKLKYKSIDNEYVQINEFAKDEKNKEGNQT